MIKIIHFTIILNRISMSFSYCSIEITKKYTAIEKNGKFLEKQFLFLDVNIPCFYSIWDETFFLWYPLNQTKTRAV